MSDWLGIESYADAAAHFIFVRVATLTNAPPPPRLRWRLIVPRPNDEITFRVQVNLDAGGQ